VPEGGYTYTTPVAGTESSKTGAGDTPFRYTGRDDDGTGLYYYRARYYHPQLACFVAEDAIGFDGGINLYAYVGGNPISIADALGLRPGDVYPSIEAAAQDAVGDVNPASVSRPSRSWLKRA
jgi:RHS repeat-associated protein